MSEAIIVIGLNWFGDVVMSLPAISAACKAGREVHVVTRPHLADVYELSGLPVVVHPVATNGNLLKVIKEMRPLSRILASSVVCLPDSIRAAFLAYRCRTGFSIGYSTQCRSFLLDSAIDKPENYKLIHESKLHYKLMREAIPELDIDPPELPLCHFSDDEWEIASNKLGIEKEKPFIVLAPGAAFGAAKRWPPEYYAKLSELIAKNHPELDIVITGGEDEHAIADQIKGLTGARVIDVCGKTDLFDLGILLSRASKLVANDSGTMHLAALYRTPTVVPVGPTDMVRTGALNDNFVPVIATGCPQLPCRKRVCPLKTDACMKSLPPDLIYQFIFGNGLD